jgi:hypothetical protein
LGCILGCHCSPQRRKDKQKLLNRLMLPHLLNDQLKICSQEGRRMPSNPLQWFRGVTPQALSLAPITATQVASNGMLERVIRQGDTNRALSDSERIICAMGAGGISSVIYSPVDLCVIQQQRQGKSPFAALGAVVSDHGTLSIMRGFFSCVAREAVYTAGYLALAPLGKEQLMKRVQWMRENEVTASLLGSCAGGTIAAMATHPIDTAKTQVQADLDRTKVRSFWNAMWQVYRNSGLAGLYRGGLARTVRTCGAFFIVSNVREQAILYKGRQEQK